jgi:AraC-like DNA-binding protein
MDADDVDIAAFMELLKSNEMLMDDLFADDADTTPSLVFGLDESTSAVALGAPSPPSHPPLPLPPLPASDAVTAAPTHSNTHFNLHQRVKHSNAKRKLKFTVREEAQARLHGVKSKKTCLIDKLVRACFSKFGQQWVSWADIKEVARDVGFSPSSHVFRSVWPLVTCRYQQQPDGSVKVQETHAINFPYWLIDRTGTCTSRYKLRLAPEFFEQ